MAGQIPFVRDMDFDYGAVTEISPLVRRAVSYTHLTLPTISSV